MTIVASGAAASSGGWRCEDRGITFVPRFFGAPG
jgi:hypothetical protein